MEVTEDDCVVCGSNLFSTLFKKKGGVFVRCLECGLIYVLNRDRHGFAPEKKIAREVFDFEVTDYMKELRDLVSKEILPYAQSGNVLDVGCATGYQSAILARAGFTVYGVEPNRVSAEWGLENFPIDIHIGYLDTVPWPPDHFDVIISTGVIEHLYRPNYELDLMKKLLKPSGLLYLRTGACQDNKFFGPDWRYCQPGEFYYFTLELLARLISQNGFTIFRKEDIINGKGELRIWGRA